MTSTWRDAARLGVGTLTRWPVRPPGRVDPVAGGRAMTVAPAIGIGLGAGCAGVDWAGRAAGLSPLLTAVLVLAGLALATRGLHLDGLADTVDGLATDAAGGDRERALAVMRRGDVGPLGVAALVLVLLVQGSALAELTSAPVTVALGVAVSRLALPVACVRGIPGARPDGLGAAVTGTVPRWAAAGLVATAAVAALVVGRSAGRGWQGPAAVAAVVLVTALVVRRAVVRLGGVTGDVLGACVELSTAAALVVLAAG